MLANHQVRPHRFALPELQTGYHLDPAAGFFSAILPLGVDRTNIVTNPSFELSTTGWAGTPYSISTLARVATKQRRGAYSLQVTPLTGDNGGGVYYLVALTAGVQYSLSLDFWGQAGLKYVLQVTTTAPANVGTINFLVLTGKSVWERVSLIGTVPTTTNYWLALTKQSGNATVTPFYIDGAQIEAGPATTYIDGDQKGFVRGRADYYWTGAPHASTSVRIGQSRAGGYQVPLEKLGFRLMSIIGLGMGGIINQMTPLAKGGAYYGGTVIADRQFSLVGQVDDSSGLAGLARKRQGLIDLFKPDVVSPDQPLVLSYTPTDDCGNVAGAVQDIVCVYEGGLAGATDNLNGERLALAFRLYLPFVAQEVGSAGAVLSYQASVANANELVVQSPAGAWSSPGSGAVGGDVYKAIYNPYNGLFYVIGGFTGFNGVANTAGIFSYDPNTGTVAALGTGLNLYGSDLAIDPNGNVVAVGAFSSAGSVANTNKIGLWNITTGAWTSVATGFTGTEILAIVVGPDGSYYTGGMYSSLGGTAANNVSKRSPAGVWSAVSTGIGVGNTDVVWDLDLSPDGTTLYAAHAYAALRYFSRSVSGAAFTVLDSNLNGLGYGLLTLPDAAVLVLGAYSLPYYAPTLWNGAALSPISGTAALNGVSSEARLLRDGLIAVVGSRNGAAFTSFNGITSPSVGYVLTNRTNYFPPDIALPASAGLGVTTVAQSPAGYMLVGFLTTGTATASAVTTVTNLGSANAGPRVWLTGPGTVYSLKNLTTGQSVYFNLTLNAGEQAVLDLSDPSNITFISNFRGNILGTILPGSQLAAFFLAPGANAISLFIAGTTTGATAAVLAWRNTHHSIDAAIPGRLLP